MEAPDEEITSCTRRPSPRLYPEDACGLGRGRADPRRLISRPENGLGLRAHAGPAGRGAGHCGGSDPGEPAAQVLGGLPAAGTRQHAPRWHYCPPPSTPHPQGTLALRQASQGLLQRKPGGHVTQEIMSRIFNQSRERWTL